ncbi:MAG: hypothetical protein KC933_14275, partial [Myxococcales bacterium]|nr:hypothetical protein [Myxococcales bacterium]
PREALALLEAAAAAYPQGGLRPEREAMRARLLLEGGRAAEAAAVLEGCTDQRTAHVLHEMRVRIADALLAADPARARALAEVVATAKVPAELRAEAERVIAASTRGDSSP